jgi:hypothetical protein
MIEYKDLTAVPAFYYRVKKRKYVFETGIKILCFVEYPGKLELLTLMLIERF